MIFLQILLKHLNICKVIYFMNTTQLTFQSLNRYLTTENCFIANKKNRRSQAPEDSDHL